MFDETMFSIGEVSEMMFNAKEEMKFAHLKEGFTYPGISEELYFAKHND